MRLGYAQHGQTLQNVYRIVQKHRVHNEGAHDEWSTIELSMRTYSTEVITTITVFFDAEDTAYSRDIAEAINTVNQKYLRLDRQQQEVFEEQQLADAAE